MQTKPWIAQRWSSIIGHRTADGQTIAANCGRLGILPPLQGAFERSDPAHLFLQFLLGMPICLRDRLRRFSQVVKVAQLMGRIGEHRRDGGANGLLPIRDDAAHWHGQRSLDFAQQRHQITLRGT